MAKTSPDKGFLLCADVYSYCDVNDRTGFGFAVFKHQGWSTRALKLVIESKWQIFNDKWIQRVTNSGVRLQRLGNALVLVATNPEILRHSPNCSTHIEAVERPFVGTNTCHN